MDKKRTTKKQGLKLMAFNIGKMERQFPSLVNKVEAGEEIIIEKSGKPIARIIPFHQREKGKRKLGLEKGNIWMSDDFTEPLPPDILKEFYK